MSSHHRYHYDDRNYTCRIPNGTYSAFYGTGVPFAVGIPWRSSLGCGCRPGWNLGFGGYWWIWILIAVAFFWYRRISCSLGWPSLTYR